MTRSPDLDAVFARIEALADARALPEVTRSTSYGTPALKVKDKSFIRLKDDETLVMLCPIRAKDPVDGNLARNLFRDRPLCRLARRADPAGRDWRRRIVAAARRCLAFQGSGKACRTTANFGFATGLIFALLGDKALTCPKRPRSIPTNGDPCVHQVSRAVRNPACADPCRLRRRRPGRPGRDPARHTPGHRTSDPISHPPGLPLISRTTNERAAPKGGLVLWVEKTSLLLATSSVDIPKAAIQPEPAIEECRAV